MSHSVVTPVAIVAADPSRGSNEPTVNENDGEKVVELTSESLRLRSERGGKMSRSLFVLIALASFALIIFPTSRTEAQSGSAPGGFVVTPIVRRGDPTSDDGRLFDRDDIDVFLIGDHPFNDAGQAVIWGGVADCSIGIYVVSNRTGVRLADVCRPAPFGRLSLFAGANINNEGQVAMNAGTTVNNRIVDMILLHSGGTFTKVAADGDVSPTGLVFGDCGFGVPIVNNRGDVAFSACLENALGNFAGNGVFVYSSGTWRKIAAEADPSPLGGVFALAFTPPPRVSINDNGDVLFGVGQIDPDITVPERFGLFLAMGNGVLKKVELSGDTMPGGSVIREDSIGLGVLNNRADVAFSILLKGTPDSGIFLYSGAQASRIMTAGERTPIGGTFRSLLDPQNPAESPIPKLNDNG
ncbi:MAG TPA: choice-of-anchor tandem repeat NxxGxxAF-containing protein, partial [Blastocatellia bacterium]|nr:choice-of-anchor tandem repeat NxxGxxAF-containing protein [Blastocatellia bacterium]